MKESVWAYLLLSLGILIIMIMMLIHNITSTSEEDYYLTKEVMEAAMLDSIDYGVYTKYGDLRMIESKFVENFVRRFSESVNNSKDYSIEFYEIYEYPPKATVRIKTNTGSYRVTTDSTVDFDILTTLSGIIGTKYSYARGGYATTSNVKIKVIGGRVDYSNRVSLSGRDVEFETTPYIKGDTIDTVQCLENGEILTSGSSGKVVVEGNKIIVKGVISDMECTASYHYNGDYRVGMDVYNGSVVNSVFENGKVTYTLAPTYSDNKLQNVICSPVNRSNVNVNANVVTISDISSDTTCRALYGNKVGTSQASLTVYGGTADYSSRVSSGGSIVFQTKTYDNTKSNLAVSCTYTNDETKVPRSNITVTKLTDSTYMHQVTINSSNKSIKCEAVYE